MLPILAELFEMFRIIHRLHTYETKQHTKLHDPVSKMSTSKKTVHSMGIHHWNNMTRRVKPYVSCHIFKPLF